MKYSHYLTLAELFYFPGEDYRKKVKKCRDFLEADYPELVDDFAAFEDFVTKTPSRRIEEIYMRTFDIQALCCMDVGYVLFGEDYTRGKILANLNQELHEAGIDSRGELADRLPNMLQLIPHLDDREKLDHMVGYLLKPALDNMVDEFSMRRINEKDETYQKFHQTVLSKEIEEVTRFKIPIQVVRKILDIDFPDVEKVTPGEGRDFMESVKNEFKNQKKNNKF
ncbi:hypothetical protein NC796_06340 [Aliifodinibius sp. S!AR15-10]|uniref:hypothetical protein n=1 Tax=Aliifodinibius sp. S!AR15-10 TaxID=2950437 RepID=UPI0028671643|nr:hypothetical protein [Aliifodinibius sp. S!AR15-10]MDR8390746.1 hypothetical protein [Aliifodinibius sp. S!AR15-10]